MSHQAQTSQIKQERVKHTNEHAPRATNARPVIVGESVSSQPRTLPTCIAETCRVMHVFACAFKSQPKQQAPRNSSGKTSFVI